MIENATAAFFDQRFEDIMFWILAGVFVLYHIAFLIYGMYVRNDEPAVENDMLSR